MGAKIFNSYLTKEIIDGAKLQQNLGGIPSEIAEKVIPVMEVNPKLLRVCNIVRSDTATNNTLYVIPTNKDFYLVSAFVQAGFTAAGQSTSFISAVIDGQTQKIVQNKVTCGAGLTANDTTSINPCFPIKIDRGTTIVLNVGNWGSGGIVGYTLDNITA